MASWKFMAMKMVLHIISIMWLCNFIILKKDSEFLEHLHIIIQH